MKSFTGIRAVAVALSMLAGATAPAAAQSGLDRPDDPELIAAAKAEGALTFYGSSSIIALQSDADKFEEAYGIPVSMIQLTSGPLTARVEQELAAGGMLADVIISADLATIDKWAEAGHLAPLPENDFPRRSEHTAIVQAVYQGVFFNTDLVPEAEAPKTWSDLLDPKYKGQIVIGSPRIAPGFSTIYYALLNDPDYGREYFEKLAAQEPRIVQTPVLVAQSVASGEAALGFTALPYEVTNMKRQAPNAPIGYKYLDVVTMAGSVVLINANAKNPNAAKLFALWMMSEEGQVAHNGDGRGSTVMLGDVDLPGMLASPDPATVREKITAVDVSTQYQDIIALFDELYE